MSKTLKDTNEKCRRLNELLDKVGGKLKPKGKVYTLKKTQEVQEVQSLHLLKEG